MPLVRRLAVVGLGALVMSVPGLACGSSGSSGGGTSVDTFDFGFKPAALTVKPGTTVTWTNSGATIHTVKGPGFFSKAINPGKRYSFKFTKPGSFKYLCTLHPTQMKGEIVVKG